MPEGGTGMNSQNLKRFALHVLFGTVAAWCALIASNASTLDLPPETIVVVVAVATAAASFFRGKAQ